MRFGFGFGFGSRIRKDSDSEKFRFVLPLVQSIVTGLRHDDERDDDRSRRRVSIMSRVSHIMPALISALNALFEKKH